MMFSKSFLVWIFRYIVQIFTWCINFSFLSGTSFFKWISNIRRWSFSKAGQASLHLPIEQLFHWNIARKISPDLSCGLIIYPCRNIYFRMNFCVLIALLIFSAFFSTHFFFRKKFQIKSAKRLAISCHAFSESRLKLSWFALQRENTASKHKTF